MAINISKYTRPGIYIEEINQAIIAPVVSEGVINLIPGFSKKGQPNSPIFLQSKADASAIIGSIDRNLEKKGSYLHRTVFKMLESGPVWALNLLLTDDTLDTLEYQSISASSGYENGDLETESYKKFFNTSGFWRRDTESFLSFAGNDNVLNFTNFGDKPITVFAIKSPMTGFKVTVQNWYEGVPADQIPTFLRPTDLISDYNIRVVIVAGDWTDYSVLAVDQRYSLYFNTEGVRKTEFNNFLNDNTVTVLGSYDGSLIPYFTDSSGRNMFIENLINLETDRTGLFCAYNFDLVETDFPNRYLDLIGNTVVGQELDSINFLSYNEVISESLEYSNKQLNSLGNTLGNNLAIAGRTNTFTDEFISGLTIDYATDFTALVVATGMSVDFTGGVGNYYNFQGAQYSVPVGVTNIAIPDVPTPAATLTSEQYNVFYLNADGLNIASGAVSTAAVPAPIKPLVPATAIVLFYTLTSVDDAGVATNTVTPVTHNAASYLWLTVTDLSAPSLTGINELEFIFAGTAGTIATNQYEEYRRVKMFNNLNTLVTGPNADYAVIIDNVGTKHSLRDAAVSVDETSDKTIRIIMDDVLVNISAQYATRTYLLYQIDNEMVIGSGAGSVSGMLTKFTAATGTEGVVAEFSDLYIDYQNGVVNTGDYFWEKLVATTGAVNFADVAGVDYLVLTNADNATFSGLPHNYGNVGDKIWIEDTVSNNGLKTIAAVAVDASTVAGLINPATSLAYVAATHTAYELVENVTSEYIPTEVVNIHKGDQKVYLQFYTMNDILYVNYTNVDYTTEITLSNVSTINTSLKIYSKRNNFAQTLEVEFPLGYVQTPNKVLVNGSRYSEVKIGDYLKAYVDTGALNPGEEPKRITRIIDKRTYSADPTLVELTTDSEIELTEFGVDDFQTMRYSEIENYVNTYKGLKLKGFKIRQESLPDGTEARQEQILDLMDSDTNLGKALIDRNSINWRYLIDGFGLGLIERSKQQYVNVCGARLNVLGFINMPSMKKFKNSTSPSFLDSNGDLSIEYIKLGANPETNPAFRYTFGQGDGQTCVGYFTPYVNISDNNRPIDVPPAMFVATTYMRKHISRVSGLKPWTIAAGVNDGRIEGINRLEQDFLPEEISQWNEMGANPLVFNTARNVHYIETENTAQQQPLSSLSYLHSRELLIELENALYNMLLDYQWKFNTPETRADIKFRADAICQRFVDQQGLFNYVNIINEQNNTSDLIDRQIGVLDTFVEISKGMGVIVNNITVLKTGAIESGGFNIAS